MRKVITWEVKDEGRDKGKVFVITEMPASQGEWWGMRVLLLGLNCGSPIPPEVAEQGLAGLAVWGIRAIEKITPILAYPLWEEMFTCVKIQPSKTKTELLRNLIEDDIEEIKTRWDLRNEVIAIHFGHFTVGSQSQALGAAKIKRA